MVEDLEKESLANLKSALEIYIKAYTINDKYVGNPKYIEDYENICKYLGMKEGICSLK